jgi:hypothetical protein
MRHPAIPAIPATPAAPAGYAEARGAGVDVWTGAGMWGEGAAGASNCLFQGMWLMYMS